MSLRRKFSRQDQLRHFIIDIPEDINQSSKPGMDTGSLLSHEMNNNANRGGVDDESLASKKEIDRKKSTPINEAKKSEKKGESESNLAKKSEKKGESEANLTVVKAISQDKPAKAQPAENKKETPAKKAVIVSPPQNEPKKVEKKLLDVDDGKDVMRADIDKDIYQIVADGDVSEFSKFMTKNPQCLNMPSPDGYYLVHLAILSNQVSIFKELLKLNADLNVQDPEGKTPLHLAILADSLEIVSTLINKGVQVTQADNSGWMPIHTAAEMGALKIVALLIRTLPNINVKAEGGLTALHIAAINNHGPVVKLLMANGASALNRDDHGNYPIHFAAKNASNSAIEAILEEAPSLGIQKLDLLALRDRDKNMPIHCAVISGNLQTVRYFLKSGALITSQQGGGSTPLHLVAAQGLIELAKVMYDIQKELFGKTLNKNDNLKRTPLHWATIFNHTEMVTYLLEKPGIKPNPTDVDGNTPLLIAASKGNIDTMSELLAAGADAFCRDRKRRNFIHLLVLAMESIPDFSDILKEIKHYNKLIKAKDVYGFTPLHYAAKCGNLAMFQDLIKLGSTLNLKSNKKQTILHLAAQFGRYKTCLSVLGKASGASLQNETDEQGQTPLHLAAWCGQIKIVSLLLNKGVSVSKDNKNNTPLHLAALQGRVDCMKLMLTTHRNLLNSTNADGNTALHLAATSGHTDAVILLLSEGALMTRNNYNCCFYDDVITRRHNDVALAIIQHQRWREVFQYLSVVHGTFMIGLIKRLPDICLIVLDMCVTNSEHDPSSEEFFVDYNFMFLNLPENFKAFAQYNKIHYKPLLPLEEMVRNNRVELLSHPLCVNYLRMKWRKYGVRLNFSGFAMYIIYLGALTWFILHHDPFDHYEGPGNILVWRKTPSGSAAAFFNDFNDTSTNILSIFEEDQQINMPNASDMVLLWFIIAYSVFDLCKGLLIVLLMRQDSISFKLLLSFSVSVSALIFALPFSQKISTHVQWNCAAICIFLSWVNCLINLQRFDLFGIYVVMFMEILKTLVKVLLIFSLLNLAFGLAFYVVMSHETNSPKSHWYLSVYHTFVMLLELDYQSAYSTPLQDTDPVTLHFPIVTFLLLMTFIVLMPILLTNLLIGLAVGDIEAVQREARLKQLATQVAFHSRAESVCSCLQRLTDESFKFYPNKFSNALMIIYSRLVSDGETYSRDTYASEGETALNRQLTKTNDKLDEIHNKLDKNIALMNQIMKRLHMNTEDDMWDEGGTTVDGIGEIEEIKTKKSKESSKSHAEKNS